MTLADGLDEDPRVDEKKAWYDICLDILYMTAGILGAFSVIAGAVKYIWTNLRPCFVRLVFSEEGTSEGEGSSVVHADAGGGTIIAITINTSGDNNRPESATA